MGWFENQPLNCFPKQGDRYGTPPVTSPKQNRTSLDMLTLARAACQHGGKHACLFLVLYQTSVYRSNFLSDVSLRWYDGGKQGKEEIRGIGLFLHHHLSGSVLR